MEVEKVGWLASAQTHPFIIVEPVLGKFTLSIVTGVIVIAAEGLVRVKVPVDNVKVDAREVTAVVLTVITTLYPL